jgi:thiamine-phosphate pyrophosphorylase
MSPPESSRSVSAGVRALPRPLIAMVTDRRLYAGAAAGWAGTETVERSRAALVAATGAAARAGVDLVQVREHGLEDLSLLALVIDVRDAIAGTGARLLVNDRVDVALAAAADGAHLPGSAVTCARIRSMVPGGFLVGRSVHSVGEAMAAAADGGCDYLFFGTVFESHSKPAGHRVAGLGALAEVCAAVALPVLAIGGMTVERVPDIVRAGAAGLAAIGLFAAGGERALRDTVSQIRLAFAAG